jgi:glycosyltransferase involved in cell wall biosynthesis
VDKAFRLLERVNKVRKLKQKLRIDVCISFLEGADYVNILSKSLDKVIISIRGSKENDEEINGVLGWIRKKVMMPWLYKNADNVVCVSAGIKDEIERTLSLSIRKVKVIPNYYDVDAIRKFGNEPLPPFAQKLFEYPCIITSGRLHPQKNHVGLLHSFAYLRKLNNECKLVILGSGGLQDHLVKTCSMLGLSVSILQEEVDCSADVFFLGYQGNPWQFMSRARLFILTSSWEGFPNVLAEAMCLGLPVASSDCPHGPKEILSDVETSNGPNEMTRITKYGVLLPILKEEVHYKECAKTVQNLMIDKQLSAAISKAGQDRIRSFSSDQALVAWRSLIE